MFTVLRVDEPTRFEMRCALWKSFMADSCLILADGMLKLTDYMRKLIILKITESMQKHPETNYICSDSYS